MKVNLKGKYKAKSNADSSKNGKHSKPFGKTHKGMLWLQDVQDFLGILVHTGNTEKDSEGITVEKSGDGKKEDK